MKPMLLDVHTHSIASGHAYGTITEMCRAARKKGLYVLGITEHTAGIPGTCDDFYFANLSVVPREYDGMALLLGAETNILDYDGTLGLSTEYLEKLDICIAGIHELCYTPGTMAQNTSAVLGAMENPFVRVISHPDDGNCPLDYDALVDGAIRQNVLLEINNNSLRSKKRKNTAANALRILSLCKRRDYPVLISSDAHFMTDIANVEHVLPLLAQAKFPDALVINYDVGQFKAFLIS